jgi:hypothetical protein
MVEEGDISFVCLFRQYIFKFVLICDTVPTKIHMEDPGTHTWRFITVDIWIIHVNLSMDDTVSDTCCNIVIKSHVHS